MTSTQRKPRLFVTRTPKETRALGARLGKLLRGLDLVCLSGNLGSGKTTLTQGIAAGAGFSGLVASPTFTLARVYRARPWTLYHLDLYRVKAGETGDIGLEDYLDDPAGFCVIEWPEAGAAYYPADRLEVALSAAPGGGRKLRLRARGPRSGAILDGLAKKADAKR